MVRPPRPDRQLTPLDPPMLPIAVGGLIGWAVAGLVLLAIRPTLAAHGHHNWLWICLAGFVLGLPGLFLMRRHDANRRAGRQRRRDGGGPAQPSPGESSPDGPGSVSTSPSS